MSHSTPHIVAYERHVAWEILEFSSGVGARPPQPDEIRMLEAALFSHPKATAARRAGADPHLVSLVATRRAEVARLGPEDGVLREENNSEQRLYDLLAETILHRLGDAAQAWLSYLEALVEALEPQYPADAKIVDDVRRHVCDWMEPQAFDLPRAWMKGVVTAHQRVAAGGRGTKRIQVVLEVGDEICAVDATARDLEDGRKHITVEVVGGEALLIRTVVIWLRNGMQVSERARSLGPEGAKWTAESGDLHSVIIFAKPK